MNKTNYILTHGGVFISQDELFHGRDIRYIDLDPDVLVHWKYIKRVKLPNGKYRYYYDDSYLKATKAKAESARIDSIRESAKQYNASEDARIAMEKSKALYGKGDTRAQTKAAIDYYNAKKNESDAKRRAEQYSDVANKYLKKYEAMKVTEFVARNIVKGLNAISNLVYKLTHKKK